MSDNIYNDQAEFTRKILTKVVGHFPLDNQEKITWTKEYLLCLIAECIEVLNVLDWKHHYHTNKEPNLSNLVIEMIDIQKYLWGLFAVWGIPYDTFIETYEMKSLEVEQKFFQNNILPKVSEQGNVCIIDIDGVLNYYPNCFIQWAKKFNKDFNEKNPIEWEQLKDKYRSMGGKRDVRCDREAIRTLAKLKEKGYIIVLLTNRPYTKYKRIYSDTLHWLDKEQVPYDYIIWADDKKLISIITDKIQVKFAVDDDKQQVQSLRAAGIKTYQIDRKRNTVNSIPHIKCIDEIKETNNE